MFAKVVLPAVIFFVCLVWFLTHLEKRRQRLINAVPLLPIAEVRGASLAKVLGKVRYLGPAIRSPILDRECAYYEVVVEERSKDGLGRSRQGTCSWSTPPPTASGVSFCHSGELEHPPSASAVVARVTSSAA